MKAILAGILKNLIGMLVTEKMILWSLRFATKQTTNKIDDNIILLVEAAYKNDTDMFQKAVITLSDEIKSK